MMIGTSSPVINGVDIVRSAGTSTYLRTSDGSYTAYYGIAPALGGAWLGTISNHPVLFNTNSAERMRIYANGGLSFGNTASPGAFNTLLGDRNNHFTGQRANTLTGGATSTMLTITFNGTSGAAIVRVVDCGTVVTANYFMNVYEYFVTNYAGTVTATLMQSQNGGGYGSLITTSTGSATFNVIQTSGASLTTVHDTAVDILVVSAGNGTHDTATITMAASN